MSGDAQLYERWRGGEQAAGEVLFERHAPRVARFFYNKVERDIDDLIQQTFLTCLEAQRAFKGEGEFGAYLLGIARNVLLHHYRRKRRKDDPIDFGMTSVLALGTSVSSVVARNRAHERLLVALRGLAVELQIVLELQFWEGMSGSEIAEALSIPLGTAKSRLRRARELLHEALATGGETSDEGSVDRVAEDLRASLHRDEPSGQTPPSAG